MNSKDNFKLATTIDLEEPQPINAFSLDGIEKPVSFVETMQVADGVECDVYRFTEDETKDLGIIRIKSGKKIPIQKVLRGEKTIEQYFLVKAN